MKTRINTISLSNLEILTHSGFYKRAFLSLALSLLLIFTQSCSKEKGLKGSAADLIGKWQHQEILGDPRFGDMHTFVTELTFEADGSGIDNSFDTGGGGSRSTFRWELKRGNKLEISVPGEGKLELGVRFTDDTNGMALLLPDNSRRVFTRMN